MPWLRISDEVEEASHGLGAESGVPAHQLVQAPQATQVCRREARVELPQRVIVGRAEKGERCDDRPRADAGDDLEFRAGARLCRSNAPAESRRAIQATAGTKLAPRQPSSGRRGSLAPGRPRQVAAAEDGGQEPRHSHSVPRTSALRRQCEPCEPPPVALSGRTTQSSFDFAFAAPVLAVTVVVLPECAPDLTARLALRPLDHVVSFANLSPSLPAIWMRLRRQHGRRQRNPGGCHHGHDRAPRVRDPRAGSRRRNPLPTRRGSQQVRYGRSHRACGSIHVQQAGTQDGHPCRGRPVARRPQGVHASPCNQRRERFSTNFSTSRAES